MPLTRKEELPPWLRAYDAIYGVIFSLVILGFGITYLVIGHMAGRIVGALLVCAALLTGFWIGHRFRRHEDE